MTAVRGIQVVIIGAGPAGLLLALLLRRAGVEAIVLERKARDHVLGRIRAGVLEDGTAAALRAAGLGARMDREGFRHAGIYLATQRRALRIDFEQRVGRAVIIYGQTKVQQDLYEACDAHGVRVVHEAQDVALAQLDSDTPEVSYHKDGIRHLIRADFVAGCDGSRGVCRTAIPETLRRTYEKVYPFGWLGVLSRSPPVSDELIYAHHERGFALCSMRNQSLSRYYVQCPLDADLAAWTDARFWDELRARIPEDAAARLVTGPIIDRSITPLRSLVIEPIRYGRLFLAGDAAHVLPPTGAKGLNLAVSDVLALSRALIAHYHQGIEQELASYSQVALQRIWGAVRFSWWMTTLLHRFPGEEAFAERLRRAELDLLFRSQAAQTVLAQNYVGLFDEPSPSGPSPGSAIANGLDRTS